MKKPSLIEEIKRFHEVSGNKNAISENFLDDLLKKVGLKGDEKNTKKVDDPKKADLVSDDVKQFFSTLENVKDNLNQQTAGNYEFQKEVESVQIALVLLGYELPKYGVDGKYGPETANAISQFKKDNKLDKKSEPITESILVSILEDFQLIKEKLEMIQLDDTSYPNVKFDTDGTQYDEVNKALLDDLQKAAEAAGVIATITTAKSGHGFLTKSGRKSRHMTQTAVDISILDGQGSNKASNETNGNPSFREKGNLLKDALVKLGYTWNTESGNNKAVLWQTNTGGNHFNHLHVSNNSGASDAELESLVAGTGSVMTPEDVKVLLGKVKEKGVTSEDLKKYIDRPVINDKINLDGLTDINFYSKLLENLGAPVSEENLKFLYAWRQSEGSGGKYNPFNTTWNLPGSTNANSVGVKNYQTLEDGMTATIKTLKNGLYSCIVEGLVNDIGAAEIAKCPSLKTWGTGDLVAKVIDGYERGASPKIKALA